MFGSRRDYVAALKVATYGAIPLLLAGATLIVPAMVIVAMVGLCHTLFLYWVGVRRVLKVPAGGGAEFVGISLVLLVFMSVLAGAAGERDRADLRTCRGSRPAGLGYTTRRHATRLAAFPFRRFGLP